MKTLLFLLGGLMIGVLPVSAQDLEPPKNGAVLRLENNNHKIAIGETLLTDVWLVRSKTNRKTSFEGLKASAAPGLLIKFTPHNQHPDRYVMNISVASEVEPGKYAVLVKGKGKNAHRVKGTTFSLVVSEQLNATN